MQKSTPAMKFTEYNRKFLLRNRQNIQLLEYYKRSSYYRFYALQLYYITIQIFKTVSNIMCQDFVTILTEIIL